MFWKINKCLILVKFGSNDEIKTCGLVTSCLFQEIALIIFSVEYKAILTHILQIVWFYKWNCFDKIMIETDAVFERMQRFSLDQTWTVLCIIGFYKSICIGRWSWRIEKFSFFFYVNFEPYLFLPKNDQHLLLNSSQISIFILSKIKTYSLYVNGYFKINSKISDITCMYAEEVNTTKYISLTHHTQNSQSEKRRRWKRQIYNTHIYMTLITGAFFTWKWGAKDLIFIATWKTEMHTRSTIDNTD